MKHPGLKYILAGIALLLAAVALSLPLWTGSRTVERLRRQADSLSAEERKAEVLSDSLAVFSALDTLTFGNIQSL